ncbi:MAG: AI-2E family transporter [Coprobacillaceae bacterium]
MKQFFIEYKNKILLCTYTAILAAMAFNYEVVIGTVFSILSMGKPLYYGIAIAFVINLPMKKIETLLKKVGKDNKRWQSSVRGVSLCITLVIAIIVLYIVLAIILPKVFSSLELIFSNFGHFIATSAKNVDAAFKEFNLDIRLSEIDAIKELQNISWQSVFSSSLSVISGLADGVIKNVMNFTGTFFQWFLSFCLSLYLLLGKEKFIVQLRKVVLAFTNSKRSQKIFEIATKTNEIFTKFVGGQLVDCLIKGVLFYIIFIILNYPMPELMAIIIAVFSIVPVFGPIAAMVVDCILLLALQPSSSIWFIIIFQVVSNLESNIIYPKIVGNSIGLPGIWVLLSIFVLGDVFGILGMLLAVPVTALLYTLFKEYVQHRLVKKKIAVEEYEERSES